MSKTYFILLLDIMGKGSTDIRQRFAITSPRQRLSNLELGELRFPAEVYSTLHCTLAAIGSPCLDQLPFELSKTAEDRQH
jgi:hypothetical protein